jgi:site-specific DNA recombinase
VNQLDKSILELQAEIDFKRIQLNSSDYVLTEAKALYKEWANMQFLQKRVIAETVTEYITIGEDTVNIALAYLPGSAQTSQRNFMDS